MIRGDRVSQRREELSLTLQNIADIVGVTVDTVKKWEKSKSNPRGDNLERLALSLSTITNYLEGKTDKIHGDSAEGNVCIICGKPIPDGLTKCPECRWSKRWPEYVLYSYELTSRRKRSHSTNILSLDRDRAEAVFAPITGNGESRYTTTLESCTCKDFQYSLVPCKHIFRLAEELGLFHCEDFEPHEDDYTMHVALYTTEHDDVDETQGVSETYDQTLASPAETHSIWQSDIEEASRVDNWKSQKTSTASNILFKLLKFVCRSFFCLVALFFILGALTHGGEWLCFPVGLVVAGLLTSATATHNSLSGSTLSWGLYGALVPVVSWIDVVMANSQSKVRGFLKGVAYSFVGIVIFLAVFTYFLPHKGIG